MAALQARNSFQDVSLNDASVLFLQHELQKRLIEQMLLQVDAANENRHASVRARIHTHPNTPDPSQGSIDRTSKLDLYTWSPAAASDGNASDRRMSASARI
eukprot:1156432-Pelagomonas_calceolata.AAC.4